VSIRRTARYARMGRRLAVAETRSACVALWLVIAIALGCASTPDSWDGSAGQMHILRPGENLYRLSRFYGVSVDAIVVTAGGPDVPQPLLAQLVPGGCLVGPFGARERQKLIRMRCDGRGNFSREELGPCRFVELLGTHGWAAA
jgi:hypothetical protein